MHLHTLLGASPVSHQWNSLSDLCTCGVQGKVAKWWIPEDCVFVDEIPHTAAGKISKLQLRKKFKKYERPKSKL